jgi:hypothetical protein
MMRNHSASNNGVIGWLKFPKVAAAMRRTGGSSPSANWASTIARSVQLFIRQERDRRAAVSLGAPLGRPGDRSGASDNSRTILPLVNGRKISRGMEPPNVCPVDSADVEAPSPPSPASRLEASPTERSGEVSFGRIAKCYKERVVVIVPRIARLIGGAGGRFGTKGVL